MMNKFSSRLTPSQIDPFLCTHIIFSMVKVDETSHDRIVPVHKSNTVIYKELVELKTKNADLKVLVSLGSYRDGTTWLINVAKEEKNRRSFVRNVILFLRKNKLDGLEINWNVRNVDAEHYGSSEDMEMSRDLFTTLCMELSIAFKPFNLTLTAQVSGLREIAEVSYDIPKLQECLDFATVVTFDFYEIPLKQRFAIHHDLLYVDDSNMLESQQTSQSSSLDFWVSSGFAKDKLDMSIGLYARTYQLFVKRNCQVGSVVNREGLEGPHTGIRGILSYYEMCANLKSHWKKQWMGLQSVPYACSSLRNEMAFYEDADSIKAKLSFVKENEYGGVSLWSLEMDDFTGLYCPTGEKFPLHRLAKSILHS